MNLPKTKKIPTILGLAIVALGLAASIFLVDRSQNIFLKADANLTPGRVRISNQNDTSLTISWFTSESTVGFVKYGTQPKKLDGEAQDERDQNGEQAVHFSHYVTLTDLQPETTYYFEIYANNKSHDDNGQPYQTLTGPSLGQNSIVNDLAFGTVFDIQQKPAEGAIVYLNMSGASLQSTLVTSAGNWAIPLQNLRSANLSQWREYDPQKEEIEIFIQDREQTASAATNTANDSPVPPISLGKNFDFQKETGGQENETGQTETVSGFNPEAAPITKDFLLRIINPQSDEKIATARPLFFGKGPAGKELEIKLGTGEKEKTTANERGDWNWTVPAELGPGEHQLTVSFLNEEGQEQAVSRLFTILDAQQDESLPAFTATGSGQLAATPTKAPEPTPTPITTTVPTPTISVTPTIAPTPTVILVATNSAETSTLANAGVVTPTLLLFGLGLVILLIGLVGWV